MRTRSPSLCHRGSRMMLRVLLALLPALGVHTAAPPLLPGADTPPRGLNTWDSFRYWASEADLLANAKAMNESGMVAAGWQYLVVDEGWYRWSNNTSLEQQQHQTIPTPNAVRNQSWAGYDQNGRFTPSLDRFPSAAGGAGLKPLCSRLAAMGVLCGVHLINGLPQIAANLKLPILGGNGATCDQIVTSQPAGSPPMCFVLKEPLGAGARAYLSSLVAQLQGWGVRFIKWDFGPSSAMIAMMVELIEEARAEILLSVNAGPQPLASMYRISNDVWDVWDDVKGNVVKIAEALPNQRPGNWPDADMLPLGRIGGLRSPLWDKGCDDHPTMLQLNCGRTNQTDFRYCECCPRQSRLTHTEGRALLSLWYIGRSPLMFGGFLPETDSATIALLANHLALGANTWGRNVSRQVAPATTLAPASPKLEAWVSTDARDTTEKTFFVGLFNFMDDIAPQTVTATLPAACGVAKQVTDLWTSNESRAVTRSQAADGAARVSRKVGPHDSALLSVQCGSTWSILMKADDMGPIPRGVAAVAAADVKPNNTVELGRSRATVAALTAVDGGEALEVERGSGRYEFEVAHEHGEAEAPRRRAGPVEGDAPPGLEASLASDIQAKFETKALQSQWLGADGDRSIALGDGSYVWLFGDTFVGEYDEARRRRPPSSAMPHSTVAKQTCAGRGCGDWEFIVATNASTGRPKSETYPDSGRFHEWVCNGVALRGASREDDRLLLTGGVLNVTGNGSWDFKMTRDNAILVANPLDDPRAWRMTSHRMPWRYGTWTAPFVCSGAEVATADDDWICWRGANNTLARVQLTDIVGAGVPEWQAMEFWSKPNAAGATPSWRQAPAGQLQGHDLLSVWDPHDSFMPKIGQPYLHPVLGWYAFIIPTLGDAVYLQTAPALTGPWSTRKEKLFTVPAPWNSSSYYSYFPTPHPELASTDRQIVMSFVSQPWNTSELFADEAVDTYFPRFVRLTMGQ